MTTSNTQPWPHAFWFVWNPKAFHKILSFLHVRSSPWFDLTCCVPVNCCVWHWMKEYVVCSSCFKKMMAKEWCCGDVKLQFYRCLSLSMFLMFSQTQWKNVFFLPRKYWSLGLCYLINQFAEVGSSDELRSRKLWFLPVAAEGPGAALGICVCAILL